MKGTTKKEKPTGWPCACVRRDEAGNLSGIKVQPLATKRCNVCRAERPEFGAYLCPDCGELLERDSDKAWIKSYCSKFNRTVRAYRI